MWARDQRLKEMKMWSIIREMLVYLIFLSLLYFVTYSNVNQQSFDQVRHLRQFFLNSRQVDRDFTQVSLKCESKVSWSLMRLDIDEE